MNPDLHHTPGRVRVRALAVKRNPAKAHTARASLAVLPGIARVEIRSVTGSITVYFDAEVLTVPAILDRLKADGVLAADPPLASPAHVEAGARSADLPLPPQTEKVARMVAGMALEKVIERSAAALIGAVV